ncbi:MAG: c-type cytochrome, partial [Pseudanabaenales cyanobacterium]|nr:c-type cytochrome [Pseudanabaenales cyanobacterium]
KVTTNDGVVFDGVVERRDETGVRLRLEGEEVVEIPSERIAESGELQSAMPAMDETLSPAETRDLIAYLLSL